KTQEETHLKAQIEAQLRAEHERQRLTELEAESAKARADVQERTQREHSLLGQIKTLNKDRDEQSSRLAEVEGHALQAQEECERSQHEFERVSSDYERRLTESEIKRAQMEAQTTALSTKEKTLDEQ